ncbi:MAG: glycosyltransferase family 2 protein [Candidatus Bathyarchaeia archaeon]|jgi:cellulose synthase/poly-beta-1,6-N-acetylglucosamine synthase-like glycosyltransferase
MIEWLIAIYFASFMVISVYTVALLIVIVRYRRYRPPTSVNISNMTPNVTVQLPVYNPEVKKFTRCLDAVVKMKYPSEHLQIQVLDDSTNPDVVDFVREACASKGIEFLHRNTREGYRAGAFANSMPSVRGEYIAIINVDCIPPTDFLEKMVGAIHANPKVGYVMSNHVFHNRSSSGQTRVTSFILDMGIMNLNGLSMLTGFGVVIRKQAIIDAGGWQGDTICDDYDTGARILSKGYSSLFLRDVEFPCEAPDTLKEYRRTAERWARASGQYMRKDICTILRGKIDKFDKFLLLTLSTGFVQMLASVVNLIAVLILIGLNAIPGPQYTALWSVVSVTGFSLYIYYYHVTKFRDLPVKRHFRDLILAVVVGYGSVFFVSYNLLKGLFETGANRAVMRVNSTTEWTVVDALFIILTGSTLLFALFYGNAILSAYMLLNLVGITLIRKKA